MSGVTKSTQSITSLICSLQTAQAESKGSMCLKHYAQGYTAITSALHLCLQIIHGSCLSVVSRVLAH